MKALVGAFNQEKALVGAFSVIVQMVVEPMDRFTALVETIFAVPQSCRLDDVGSFCPCFRPQMAARQLELHRDTHLQHPAGPIRGEAGHHVTTMGQSEAGAGSRDTCAGYK